MTRVECRCDYKESFYPQFLELYAKYCVCFSDEARGSQGECQNQNLVELASLSYEYFNHKSEMMRNHPVLRSICRGHVGTHSTILRQLRQCHRSDLKTVSRLLDTLFRQVFFPEEMQCLQCMFNGDTTRKEKAA